MSAHAELGMNRTGIATSPKLTSEMLEGQREFAPDHPGDERAIALSRTASVREWHETLGSVPPPVTVKGVVKAGVTALTGESPTLLLDKMGARLAFERSGVRLYETLISKLDATGSFPGGPARADLENILADELRHFRMLIESMEHLGADPTVMTPTADLQAIIGSGALQVLVEPRTNFAQCLEAALTIELVDNASWETLIALAREANQVELEKRFSEALIQESEHLLHIKRWLWASQGIQRH
jgi:bacterioferritin (cytochrome b1)